MARQLRLEHPGAVWHITSRGNERKEIFRDDADRERFLGLLSATYGPRLHAAGCQPASTLLGVAALFHPDILVEIEATAAV